MLPSKITGHTDEDAERFARGQRVYIETSAFNFLIDNVGLAAFEATRAYQREKGVIFVTSPMLLWEIMLNGDRQRADMMLMAAQALFDPVLLGSPTELAVRYLRSAYPQNVVNYEVNSALPMAELWAGMTSDFGRTFNYDVEELRRKSQPMRDIAKNLSAIIADKPQPSSNVDLARRFVTMTYGALSDDLLTWGLDEIIAKFVILYAYLLLLTSSDLDGSAARDFWREKGFVGSREGAQVTAVFRDYPEIFVRGPILEMAVMAALQYRSGKTNRGAIYDGMHMVYAPYVSAFLSNDAAFLALAESQPHYQARLFHMSQIKITGVEVKLDI